VDVPERSDAEGESETTSQWDPSQSLPESLLELFSDPQMIDALRELPEEIRWTLLLVDVQELDHAQAAEILDVPVGTIKSRAHRGRAMLKSKLIDAAQRMKLA
jgi:RNA polymerase sigma-70 factor (ECF subfamily)